MSSTCRTRGLKDKMRKNVVLSFEAIKKGRRLAKVEKRDSFSNLIEVLIDREFQRRFKGAREEIAA